jgi:hypothetical protein
MNRRRFLLNSFAWGGISLSQPGASWAEGVYDVRRYGAKGNGIANDTKPIQHAIDSCARNGGGTVQLPSGGTYLCGTLVLKSHVNLRIEDGAILKASGSRDDFRAMGALIFAHRAEDVSISGRGRIDGNFHAFLQDRVEGGYKVTQPFLGPYDPLYGVEQRNPPDGRPRMILLVECSGARLTDFSIIDSPTWTIHPLGCENLAISGVTIRNSLEVPNCDGIDIDHCRNVRVENCDIQAGDDCIVLKTSRNYSQFGACENISVGNCVLTSTSAGIKVEPEGADAIRNAVFYGCTISNSNRGIAILNRDQAVVEDLIFSDMTITTELKPSMWWGAAEPLTITNLPRSQGATGGIVHAVQFNNIICQGESGVYVRGWNNCPVHDISWNNVAITVRKTSKITGGFYDLRPGDVAGGTYNHTIAGMYCEQAANLALRNVTVEWVRPMPAYYGPALVVRSVEGLSLSHFEGHGAHPGKDPDKVFDNVSWMD